MPRPTNQDETVAEYDLDTEIDRIIHQFTNHICSDTELDIEQKYSAEEEENIHHIEKMLSEMQHKTDHLGQERVFKLYEILAAFHFSNKDYIAARNYYYLLTKDLKTCNSTNILHVIVRHIQCSEKIKDHERTDELLEIACQYLINIELEKIEITSLDKNKINFYKEHLKNHFKFEARLKKNGDHGENQSKRF